MTRPSPPPSEEPALAVALAPHLDPAGVRSLCRRAEVALRAGAVRVVECDASALVHPDLGAIDGLARLALTARRHGGRTRILGAPVELRNLLALAGLADVVLCVGDSAREPRR